MAPSLGLAHQTMPPTGPTGSGTIDLCQRSDVGASAVADAPASDREFSVEHTVPFASFAQYGKRQPSTAKIPDTTVTGSQIAVSPLRPPLSTRDAAAAATIADLSDRSEVRGYTRGEEGPFQLVRLVMGAPSGRTPPPRSRSAFPTPHSADQVAVTGSSGIAESIAWCTGDSRLAGACSV